MTGVSHVSCHLCHYSHRLHEPVTVKGFGKIHVCFTLVLPSRGQKPDLSLMVKVGTTFREGALPGSISEIWDLLKKPILGTFYYSVVLVLIHYKY